MEMGEQHDQRIADAADLTAPPRRQERSIGQD
jgi:hypothetical protein